LLGGDTLLLLLLLLLLAALPSPRIVLLWQMTLLHDVPPSDDARSCATLSVVKEQLLLKAFGRVFLFGAAA
jgi:hypothetical protein